MPAMYLPKTLSLLSVYHAMVGFRACLLGTASAMSVESGRREMIGRTITSAFGGVVSSAGGWLSSNAVMANAIEEADSNEPSFTSYEILPDASSNLAPTLQKIAPSDLNQVLAMTNSKNVGCGALWLGEHHNSVEDHQLQANFVRKIHELRRKKLVGTSNMSVGLEMVQVQFQQALDAYIGKRITANEMMSLVEWEKRWSWSFEGYLPVFETCRDLNIPLVALNVDSEDLSLVESGGFPNLPRDRLEKYISDPAGFAQYVRNPYYKTYVDYVISPSYDMHKQMGILRSTITGQQLDEDMPFARFFSGRILWDESMASNAYRWTKANRGLMIGLVGADHVKFNAGIPGRYQRMSTNEQLGCISVVLNPSLIDTRPSGSVSIESNSAASASGVDGLTLQLRYPKLVVDAASFESRDGSNTGGVLPLADFIVVTKTSV